VGSTKRGCAILCGGILLAGGGAPAARADTGPGNDPTISAYTERVPSVTGSKPVARATKHVKRVTTTVARPAPAVTTVAQPVAQPAVTPAPKPKPKPRLRPAKRATTARHVARAVATPKPRSVVTASGSGLGDAGWLLAVGALTIALAVGLLAWRARRS
jgi:hypothetical protein